MEMRSEGRGISATRIVVGLWTVTTTIAALYLGAKTYSDSSAKDTLEAREKLDQFVMATRKNYGQRCNSETELMRESWSERYSLLLKLAKIDPARQPYSQVCKKIIYGVPSAPPSLQVSIVYPHPVATYANWEEFSNSERKVATLWVEDIPVEVDITSGDFSLLKDRIEKQRQARDKCTNAEREKPENKFDEVECKFGIDGDNNVALVPEFNRN